MLNLIRHKAHIVSNHIQTNNINIVCLVLLKMQLESLFCVCGVFFRCRPVIWAWATHTQRQNLEKVRGLVHSSSCLPFSFFHSYTFFVSSILFYVIHFVFVIQLFFFQTPFNASNQNEEPVVKSVAPTEQFLFYLLLQKPNAAGKKHLFFI